MTQHNKPIKPTDLVQFSQGPKKGLFAQTILLDGELKFLCRDWDGSQRVFVADEGEKFFIVGTAALGPGTGASPAPVLQPAVPPPLNPEELLAPLPPEVKAQPMNQPIDQPKKPKEKKPQPAPWSGALVPYIFKVTNGDGDVAEVKLQVRDDKKTSQYKGAAIIQALKVLAPTKPYKVECIRMTE